MFTGYKKIAAGCLLLFSLASWRAYACDDTLIVLLTAQDPTSEFALAIRSFNSELSTLGASLKEGKKNNYNAELSGVMKSWLEFSKSYMSNPPSEAKNDRNWVQKTSYTSKAIGEIRRDILDGRFYEAHNKVLALSGYLGKFFEAFGVSDEKQIFLTVSEHLISLEHALLENDKTSASAFLAAVKNDLTVFCGMLSAENEQYKSAEALLNALEGGLNTSEHLKTLDNTFVKLQAVFEQMRSEILLQEWFPSVKK